MPHTILTENQAAHSAIRRNLSHGFSDRSMKAQEPMIGRYIDTLIDRLRSSVANGKEILDMRDWYTFTTFDVIGDLGFGSSFNCLDKSDYHPWVRLMTGFMGETHFITSLRMFGAKKLSHFIVKYFGGMKERKEFDRLSTEKVKQRVELGCERPDVIEGLIKMKEDMVGDMCTLGPLSIPPPFLPFPSGPLKENRSGDDM